NDFVELFNLGSTTVDLSTWSVQYASATGSTWLRTNLTGMIQPGHYYLVQLASGGAVGASLPAANATGTTNISATKGKLALVNNQTALTSCGDSSLGVVDEVGYGTSADCFEGNAAAPAGSNTLAILRLNSGCTNSNNNNNDFTTGTPTPRNLSSPIHNCTSPDLTLTNTHTGNFQQGNTGSYTITVTNSGTAATSGTVTMTDTLPSGLSAAGFSGIGWTFDLNTLTATRSDALAPGISYPSITLTVNVASTAPSNLANLASVSGGGESNLANDSASDPTNVRTPSEAWREQWFGTTQNSGNAADSYIAAGDGMPNLLKYAFNLNPLVPAVAPITYDITNGHLRMTVTRNPNAFDISFFGEVTGDLTSPASWTTDNTTIDQNTSSLLQVHDNADLTAPHYIHLKVTRP
ncbi:MAG: lamin tail domain-containing protein, partial [Chthoniobacterales bacterium]